MSVVVTARSFSRNARGGRNARKLAYVFLANFPARQTHRGAVYLFNKYILFSLCMINTEHFIPAQAYRDESRRMYGADPNASEARPRGRSSSTRI